MDDGEGRDVPAAAVANQQTAEEQTLPPVIFQPQPPPRLPAAGTSFEAVPYDEWNFYLKTPPSWRPVPAEAPSEPEPPAEPKPAESIVSSAPAWAAAYDPCGDEVDHDENEAPAAVSDAVEESPAPKRARFDDNAEAPPVAVSIQPPPDNDDSSDADSEAFGITSFENAEREANESDDEAPAEPDVLENAEPVDSTVVAAPRPKPPAWPQIGAWVRDAYTTRGFGDVPIGGTGADGIVVHIHYGWRTILCADGIIKRHPPCLDHAPGEPQPALLLEFANWRAPEQRPRPAPRPLEPQAAAPRAFAIGSLVANVDLPEHKLEVVAVAVDGETYTLRYRSSGAWRGRETTFPAAKLMTYGAKLPSRRRRAAPPAPKKRAAATPAPKAKPVTPAPKKKKARRVMSAAGDDLDRHVTSTASRKPPAARDAPEGAVFDRAAWILGEWRSPRVPGSTKNKATPLWCIWRQDVNLLDDDDEYTPLPEGAWQVRWSDRTESFLARGDVRICVPTRERLRAEAQAPTPLPMAARRVTESPQAPPRPRPPTPPPAPPPAPTPALAPVDEDSDDGVEDHDVFGPGAQVVALYKDGHVYKATVVRAFKATLRVEWEDGGIDSAPREECELLEPAPKRTRPVILTDEEKCERRREQSELRSMAQHDKPALLVLERRAMALEDKPLYRRAARPADRRDWYGDVTAVNDGLIVRARKEDENVNGCCVRLAVGGTFLSSQFSSGKEAEQALVAAATAQRCICGRSEGGDYIKCAGGATGRCHGVVHRRCVGLTADEEVPEGWLCPLCDTRGVASKISVHGGPLATPLIGRVLLQTPGAEAAASAPLLLRAVGARTRREATAEASDASKPPPSGSRVAVKFDRGEEYEGTIGELDGNSATIHFDDGQSEKFKFPDPDVRVTSGNDVVVRCRALFGDDEVFEISEAAARHAARRRETAELQAQTAMLLRGGKYVFQTSTPDCDVCHHCLDKPRNGGPATLKKACLEKDGERAIALLYLASGAPPPGGGRWLTHNLTAPNKPRPAKSKSLPKNFDASSLPVFDPDDEDIFGRGAKVVAPWLDGRRYPATVIRPHREKMRVIFEDGTLHTVQRTELDIDDSLVGASEGDACAAGAAGDADGAGEDEKATPARPKKRPKPLPPPKPPRVAPTEPCAICMSMIDVDEAYVLQCSHAFHADCLRQLGDHVRISSATRRSLGVSCPLCRKVWRAEVGVDAADEA